MKIVAVNGSARKGNTYTVMQAYLKGAEGKHEIEWIYPDQLKMACCTGCGACQCKNGCVADDDTNTTVDKLINADLILFATPVYWWGMTAQLKLLIDKCYCKASYLKEKKVAVLITGGSPVEHEQYELIRRQFECMAKYLKWDLLFVKSYFAYGKDDMKKDAAALEDLTALGAQL